MLEEGAECSGWMEGVEMAGGQLEFPLRIVRVAVGEWYGLPLEAARLAACKCLNFPLKIGRWL